MSIYNHKGVIEMEDIPASAPVTNVSRTKALTVRLNPWWLVTLLSVALLAVVFMWHPWQQFSTDRTIQVSGGALLKAEPDEFIFSPSYEFKNGSKEAGLASLTSKSETLIVAIKKLGISDSDIKSNANSYSDYYVYSPVTKENTYTLILTITTHTKEMAQKVQDYLIATSPTGTITPQATFSIAKQKELESKGRDEATKDARGKAEQQAKNLGFKLGAVKTVSDAGYSGGVVPMYGLLAEDNAPVSSNTSLSVQPGQNDLSYTIDVTYYIR